MATSPAPILGGIYCAIFVTLEAIQSVYFGAVFQRIDSFLVGALVFGIVVLACLIRTVWVAPGQFSLALAALPEMTRAALATMITWLIYFIALQLLEPAVVYTVFSGMVPLVIALAALLDVDEAEGFGGAWGRAGHSIIGASIAFLCLASLLGWTGFSRGGWLGALWGVAAVLTAAVASSWSIFCCRRLDQEGLDPNAQFGLRYLPYIGTAALAALWGIDSKGPVSAETLAEAVVIGVPLIALPSYLVQRAMVLVSPLAIGVGGALGPCLVFGLQALQGRIAYSSWSLAGVIVYSIGALVVTAAQVGAGRRQGHLDRAPG